MASDSRTDESADALTRALVAATRSVARLADAGAESGLDAGDLDALRNAERTLASFREHADDSAARLFLDVSDLLGYFPYNRLPTGIQRVQIEVVTALLEGERAGSVHLCRFLEARNAWAEVPVRLFLAVAAASKAGGDATAADWLELVARLNAATGASGVPPFGDGAVLVNLGTSWWLPNYFAYIRQLKAEHAIRYVPLIYDMIPARLPDYCNIELVHEFVGWLVGVLRHADFFLAISEATKRDLVDMAERLGRPVAPERVAVVPLDADFRQITGAAATAADPPAFGRPHVLFVSTIEARKNQLGALGAWQTLINRHGPDAIPQLVLIGKLGFHGPEIIKRIADSPSLSRRVTVLSGVDDATLAALYRTARFTIYPSFYEGWGLPVTESLCYGRVPLVADNSSLPEAGGDFAIYHPTGSTDAMVAALEKLIFDHAHRAAAEKRIADGFRARGWAEVAEQLIRHVAAFAGEETPAWRPPVAMTGRYYPMTRNRSQRVWRGIGSAEPFRRGGGWWQLEDWGCWMRSAGGELEIGLDHAGPLTLALELRGLPDRGSSYGISVEGVPAASGWLEAHRFKWVLVDLPARAEGAAARVRMQALEIGRVQGADTREFGLGLAGFFLFDPDEPGARSRFVEAVALGGIRDFDAFRRID